MTLKAIYLLFVCTLVSAFSCLSQVAIETPQHFGQFYNNPILNLARNGLNSKLEVTLGNQRNVGGFSGVSTSYTSLFYNPKTEENSKNIYGVFIYNDKEGDFLFRRKAQFSFARHQQISEKWNLALALSGGFHIFGIKPTASTGAYSATSFEGNSSLLLYSNTFQFGLSMNQFSSSKIRPVSQEIVMKRHYYLFSQYSFKRQAIEFLPSAYLKYIAINDPLSIKKNVTTGLSLRAKFKVLMAGISYDYNGLYFTAGLNDWGVKGKKLSVDLSYNVPTNKSIVNVNRMEINLRLKI